MKANKLYYFLTLLVIAISGNPAISFLGKESIYIFTLTILMVLWWLRPLKLTMPDILVLILFGLLTLTHLLNFGSITILASLGVLVRLSIALLAVRLIPDFQRRYIIVIYFLSLISLFFWVPLFFGIDLQKMLSVFQLPLGVNQFHIGIFNLRKEYDGSIRNMGMFWEPGAFSGYLILALFFLVRFGKSGDVLSKHSLVLAVTLLSTQSTTGYIAFMMLAVSLMYNAGIVKDKLLNLLIFPTIIGALVGISYATTTQVSFLGEKINSQFKSAAMRDDPSRINRFGNFLYDLEWIEKRPVFGWSANPATRLSIDREVRDLVAVQGNGLTGFAVRFGLIGLLSFIGFLAYATKRVTGSTAASFFSVVIICILLNGEQFLGFPIFLSLMFIPRDKSRPFTASSIAYVKKLRFSIPGSRGRV